MSTSRRHPILGHPSRARSVPLWAALLALSSSCVGGISGGEAIDLSTVELTVFEDPDSDFTTDQILDVDGEALSFTTDGRVVWAATSMAWAESRNAFWTTDGNTLRSDGHFMAVYGTWNDTFGAWVIATSNGFLCDFQADDDVLHIDSTEEAVAQP